MQKKSPLVIGEVLFDQFDDGRKVLGGAPFNVAWNLQGLGHHPRLVTRIGGDALGAEITQQMKRWGMDQSGVQVATDRALAGEASENAGRDFHENSDSAATAADHSSFDNRSVGMDQTGIVDVTVTNGQPTYDIVFPRAYDSIRLPSDLLDQLDLFSILYCGTLALRSSGSRQTIESLNAAADRSELARFVDINVREPWFDPQWLDKLLTRACYVKMNESELGLISGVACSNGAEIVAAVQKLWQRFGEAQYWITCGASGAWVISPNKETSFAAAPAVSDLVDTVGAGDAFTAMVIDGILARRPLAESLEQAVHFAAKVCSIQGATVMAHNFYQTSNR